MDDDRRAFREQWELRVALRRFESAFEAADRLPEAERAALLKVVASRLLQNLPEVPSGESSTAEVEAGGHDNPSDATQSMDEALPSTE